MRIRPSVHAPTQQPSTDIIDQQTQGDIPLTNPDSDTASSSSSTSFRATQVQKNFRAAESEYEFINESESRFGFGESCLNPVPLATWRRRWVLTIINDLRQTSVLQQNSSKQTASWQWIIKMCKIAPKTTQTTNSDYHITSLLYSICHEMRI